MAKDTNPNVVIAALNRARSAELGAILQYMSQHYELEDRDFGQLAAEMKHIGIDEMKHAEKLADRILVLEGVPTSDPNLKPKKGQSIEEMMAQGISLEETAIKDYNESLHVCRQNNDYVSAKVFEELVCEEQEHLLHFQDVVNHIKELGAAYLATLVGGAAEK
ncbi:MAG: ferritin-like domain-containing protein [Planctomycetota bacterium]